MAAPPGPLAEFFLFEAPRPPPVPEAVPEPVPAVPPAARELPPQREPQPPPQREPPPAPRAAEPVVPVAPPIDVVPREGERPSIVLPSGSELAEARERAAEEVVTSRAAENEFLTFSIDDVAPPRPEPEPKPERSIFDGGPGSDFGGRSVGTVGQQRTKFGRKLAELCNALTGGFGVGFQGFGLFRACASPDGGPSGLFPEVRPAYLDLMPECVDTRDTAPALALEAPFPTVKCRLVKQEDLEGQP
jgi:hypothetical protein